MTPRMMLMFGIPVGMIIAWFLFSPLFIDQQVDEALPGTEPSTVGTSADTNPSHPGSDLAHPSKMDAIMTAAAKEPDTMIRDAMPPMEKPVVLANGIFSDADEIHQGAGRAAIYALPDGKKLLRFEDFRVTNGPDLVVYLAAHPDPKNADDVEAGFTKLESLKGNVGSQNYEIPADLDLTEYGSAVIWCELFGVLFSAAPLSTP